MSSALSHLVIHYCKFFTSARGAFIDFEKDAVVDEIAQLQLVLLTLRSDVLYRNFMLMMKIRRLKVVLCDVI